MTISPTIKKNYLHKLAVKQKRADGRKFDEYRDISIETGVIKKAEGSARVKIGNTQVVAGIKMDIGEPYPDTPDSGVMTTAAELIPLASPDFEAGPPREDAIELARVVDRGIRESNVIELEKLCLTPGEKIIIVFIDIHIIDYDGNLFDAASLAALAALFDSRMPMDRLPEEDRVAYEKKLKDLGINPVEETIKTKAGEEVKVQSYFLPMREPPISCTFIKFNDTVVVDPSLDEEDIAEARLTVATDSKGAIRAMQKGLNGSFTLEETQKIIKDSIITGNALRKQLNESTGR
jgi:exosome complex component RRP42